MDRCGLILCYQSLLKQLYAVRMYVFLNDDWQFSLCCIRKMMTKPYFHDMEFQVALDRSCNHSDLNDTPYSDLSAINIWLVWHLKTESSSSPGGGVYTSSSIESTSTTSRRCCGTIRHIVHRLSMSMLTSNTSWLCIIASSCSWCIISRSSLHLITQTSLWIIASSLSIKHWSSLWIVSRSSKCIVTSQPLWVVRNTPLRIVSRPCRCNVTRPSGRLITSPCRSWTRLSSSRSSCSAASATTTGRRERTTSLSNKMYDRALIFR